MSENNQTELSIADESQAQPMARNISQGIKGIIAFEANHLKLRNTVKLAVLRAYASTNREETTTNLTFIVDGLRDEILRAFPAIRLEEIGLAIHKGAMGEYEKIYTLSLATFVSFIRAYMNSDLRLTAFKNNTTQGQLLLTEYKPSEIDLEAARKEIVLNAFEKFKKFKIYNDHGNYVFDSLAKIGVLKFTDVQVNELWKYARKNVFSDLYHGKTSLADRNERLKKIDEVKANPQHYLFFMEAKKLGLKMFFDELVDLETELKDLIDNSEI